MKTQTPAPVTWMTLDIKKHRFRIPSKTFQLIDNPEYFRLLVNPHSMGLVIEKCSEYARGSYQLSMVPQHRACYEMTSKSLMDEIMRCAGITAMNTIRLDGHRISGQNAILFHIMTPPTCVSASNSEKEG